MFREIERKFLVEGDAFLAEAYDAVRITQGYLSAAANCTVRVRTWGDKGFITVKGRGGVSRFEWEKEIPLDEALELLKLAQSGIIDKTRHLVHSSDGVHVWEVDVFHGDNEGLVVAEVELGAEDETFPKPAWLGEEVTFDVRYRNTYLSVTPFKEW